MDYMRLAKWTAITVLLLYLATAPLIGIVLPLRITGTVYDTGPSGYSQLLAQLRDANHAVYTTLPDPNAVHNPLVLIIDPVFCTPDYITTLTEWLTRVNATRIIVAGDTPCTPVIASALARLPIATEKLVNQGTLLIGKARIPTATILEFQPPPGASIYARVAEDNGVAGLVVNGVTVIGDADFLRNSRLTPEALAALGVDECPNCPVVIPAYLETGVLSISIPMYLITLYLLALLVSIERALWAAYPGLMALAYTIAAGYIAYRLTAGRLQVVAERIYSRMPPPPVISATRVYHVIEEKGLRVVPARHALINLYNLIDTLLRARVGVGIEDVLRNPTLLEATASELGVEPRELQEFLSKLHRLYLRATGRKRWPPIVLWGRSLRRLLSQARLVTRRLRLRLEELVAASSVGGGKG